MFPFMTSICIHISICRVPSDRILLIHFICFATFSHFGTVLLFPLAVLADVFSFILVCNNTSLPLKLSLLYLKPHFLTSQNNHSLTVNGLPPSSDNYTLCFLLLLVFFRFFPLILINFPKCVVNMTVGKLERLGISS